MRILFLSRWYPWPIDNGIKIRVFHTLRLLAEVHDITLLSFIDAGVEPERDSPLDQLCRRIYTLPWKQFQPTSGRALRGLLSPKPRSVIDTFSPAMAGQIQRLLAKETFDLVIAQEWDSAAYQPYFKQMPALFENAEVGLLHQQFASASSVRDKIRFGLSWAKHRRYLARLIKQFSVVTTVSENEKRLLTTQVVPGTAIEVLPNFIDLSTVPANLPEPRIERIIFSGSFRYHPNYEGMVWFINQVWPRILARRPHAELVVTGNHAGLTLPEAPNITMAGFVEDIQAYIASAWISIVPLLSGGGTRLKILEAMGLQTPVVSTAKGAEGLAVSNGRDILLGDTPEAFAAAILRLLDDTILRDQLTTNAYHLVRKKYDLAVIRPRLLRLVEAASGLDKRPETRDKRQRKRVII